MQSAFSHQSVRLSSLLFSVLQKRGIVFSGASEPYPEKETNCQETKYIKIYDCILNIINNTAIKNWFHVSFRISTFIFFLYSLVGECSISSFGLFLNIPLAIQRLL